MSAFATFLFCLQALLVLSCVSSAFGAALGYGPGLGAYGWGNGLAGPYGRGAYGYGLGGLGYGYGAGYGAGYGLGGLLI